jgi:fucose permease
VALLLVVFLISKIPDLHADDESNMSVSEEQRLKPTSAQQVFVAIVLAVVCGLLYFFIAPILGLIWALLDLNPAWFVPTKYCLLIVAYIAAFMVVSKNWDLFRRKHFTLGVAAQFFYVAGQTGIFSFCVNYILENDPGVTRLQASQWLGAIGFVLFMVGRMCGSVVISQVRPERVLAIYSVINVVLVAVTMGGGKPGLYAMFTAFFFMSIGFPTIFALGIRGLGEHTKFGSSLIVMSIVGGAIAPPFMGHIADSHSMRTGFVVPLVCFAFVALYGLTWTKLSLQDAKLGAEG